jgi:hypothetical protein
MGRAQNSAAKVSAALGARRGKAFDLKARLGELHPPREFIRFLKDFDGFYRNYAVNAAEVVAATPYGADLIRALEQTTLWFLTDPTYGAASLIPATSPNRKRLWDLRDLYTRKINGEYVEDQEFERLQRRFIYDTTTPGNREDYQELTGHKITRSYAASESESAAVCACQEVLCDPEWQANLASAMSWIANGVDSRTDAPADSADPRAQEAFQALLDEFKSNVAA